MTQEELKLALEELANRFSEGWHEGIKIDASDIMLLSKAAEVLAQEQEPVIGTKTWFEDGKVVTQYLYPSDIYTTPPQRSESSGKPSAWVGLASVDRLTAKYMQDAPDGIEAVIDYIEAKLKELNT